MLLSACVIDETLMPIGDNPRNNPEIPAIAKLSATERTRVSGKSNLPSGKRKLARQYPGMNATNVNPKNTLATEAADSLGIRYTQSNVRAV